MREFKKAVLEYLFVTKWNGTLWTVARQRIKRE